MTPNEARDALWRDLGFRNDKESVLFAELNAAQKRLESDPKIELPWFLQSLYSSWNTSDGVQELALPSGFLMLEDDIPPQYYDTSEAIWIDIGVSDVGFLRANYPGEGAPKAIALVGTQVLVFPIPDGAYNIRSYLYRRGDTIVKDGPETPWLAEAPDLLIGEAGVIMAGDLRDQGAIVLTNNRRKEGMLRLMQRINQRALVGQRLQMGGSD